MIDRLSHDQNAHCLHIFVLWVRVKRETESRHEPLYPKREMTARKTRSTRTQKKVDSGSGLLSPPSSTGDKAGDRDAAGPSSTMITPPEEDEDQRSKVSQLLFA